MDDSQKYSTSTLGGSKALLGSVLLVAGFSLALFFLTRDDQEFENELTVHCAAGIRLPVENAARSYEEEFGVHVNLRYNNSGGLLSSLQVRPEGDLYIPADDLYIQRARKADLVRESIPLAKFRLVIAVKKGNPKNIRILDDLLRNEVQFVLCNAEAGAGNKTKSLLARASRWEEVKARAKVFKPTVTDAASAIESSTSVDAGVIWDTTAKQFELDTIEIPELVDGVADIEVGVLAVSKNPASALHFARYLAAPEKGAKSFSKFHFDPVPGDPWADKPVLHFFYGGVNRRAVAETIKEFRRREGCDVIEVAGGCGTLVGQITSSPVKPDLFLTCEASYMDKVQAFFGQAEDVSRTPIVLLVRKGQTSIRRLEDLAKKGVALGITEPKASALGALSVELMKKMGLLENIEPNIKVHAPTAHELVLMMKASGKLDAALVYRANCLDLPENLSIITIDHPQAHARQNIAIGRNTTHAQIAARLKRTLLSAKSEDRFEKSGFSWIAEESATGP